MAKKLKTYVITMMVKFPTQAPFLAQTTGFKKKILSGDKKHTIRHNYEFWKKRIDEINAGKAILSVRQWSGRPYNSEQKEIKQFKQGEVGYQRVTITGGAADVGILTSCGASREEYKARNKACGNGGYLLLSDYKIKKLAKNDGITLKQMQTFFKSGVLDGIIIHFSKMRY